MYVFQLPTCYVPGGGGGGGGSGSDGGGGGGAGAGGGGAGGGCLDITTVVVCAKGGRSPMESMLILCLFNISSSCSVLC